MISKAKDACLSSLPVMRWEVWLSFSPPDELRLSYPDGIRKLAHGGT